MTPPKYDDVYFEAMRIMDAEDRQPVLPGGAVLRHTTAADDLSFDRLWDERQEIAEIVRRAIREGKRDNGKGYKKIREILERIS